MENQDNNESVMENQDNNESVMENQDKNESVVENQNANGKLLPQEISNDVIVNHNGNFEGDEDHRGPESLWSLTRYVNFCNITIAISNYCNLQIVVKPHKTKCD